MQLEIRLLAGMEKQAVIPENAVDKRVFTLTVDAGLSLGGIFQLLELRSKYPIIALVNGKRERADFILKDGDRIAICPPFGGEYAAASSGLLRINQS